VELVDGPRGAQVVHRTGYHAPRPESERPALERLTQAAASILAGDEVGGLPAALRATVFGYGGGSARVPVLVEVAGRGLLEERRSGDLPAELFVYAFDREGAVADFLARSITLDPADAAAGGEPAGVKLVGELDLAPGRYEIRALVRSGSGLEAVRSVTLEIPAPGAGPGLLPPLFIQGPGERWMVASLEDGVAGEGSAEGEPYPFMVEGKRIAPAAAPVLALGEPARLLLAGVGLTAEGVALDTRIVDESGEPVRPARLRILGRRASEAGQPDLLVAELDPAGLAPGGYLLEVTLAGTGQRVTAPFRVSG
jgi:hypothetical protein